MNRLDTWVEIDIALKSFKKYNLKWVRLFLIIKVIHNCLFILQPSVYSLLIIVENQKDTNALTNIEPNHIPKPSIIYIELRVKLLGF